MLIVNGTAELDWPTPTTGNVTWDGLIPSPPVIAPPPFKATDTADTPRVDVETASAAAMAPVDVGVNTTCTVQLLPLGRLEPQFVPPKE